MSKKRQKKYKINLVNTNFNSIRPYSVVEYSKIIKYCKRDNSGNFEISRQISGFSGVVRMF